MTPQEEYDAFYEREFRGLFQRLLDSQTSVRNKAGVSLLMSTYAIGFHAARAGELDAHLGRAPYHSQVDVSLSFLGGFMVKGDRPKPKLVDIKMGRDQ